MKYFDLYLLEIVRSAEYRPEKQRLDCLELENAMWILPKVIGSLEEMKDNNVDPYTRDLRSALALMVIQYCSSGDILQHTFMSAEEGAFDLLGLNCGDPVEKAWEIIEKPKKEADLLPCPFCGRNGRLLNNYSNRWTVGCTNMECAAFRGFFRVHDNQKIAESLWNTRTQDLSFLDKPEVVEVVDSAIGKMVLEVLHYKPEPDTTLNVNGVIGDIAKAAIAATKRMAKEHV